MDRHQDGRQEGEAIGADRLPASECAVAVASPETAAEQPADVAALSDVTRDLIAQALSAGGEQISEAARRLGVHRRTVYRYVASLR